MTDNTRKKIVRWFWILLLVPIALVFILLVKNIKTRKIANASGLEAFAEED